MRMRIIASACACAYGLTSDEEICTQTHVWFRDFQDVLYLFFELWMLNPKEENNEETLLSLPRVI